MREPLYVYRMWDENVPLNEIESAMIVLRQLRQAPQPEIAEIPCQAWDEVCNEGVEHEVEN